MSPAFYSERQYCSLCRAHQTLTKLFSLPETPLANEFVKDPSVQQDVFPLDVVMCASCRHVQLGSLVDPGLLFRDYVYVSGTSQSFVQHFEKYAQSCIDDFKLPQDAFILEVGSNDGTLLKQFQKKGYSNVLGVDPAVRIAAQASADGVPTLCHFFDGDCVGSILKSHGQADLIVANNVFAHAPDLNYVGWQVFKALKPGGVFVFEVSYLGSVVEGLLFDTIYHEHMSYNSVSSLASMFEAMRLKLFRVDRVPTHGGSIRCFVGHDRPRESSVDEFIAAEAAAGLLEPGDIWKNFRARIETTGEALRNRLAYLHTQSATVAGFGAPAKLTTLMYSFGLGPKSVDFIADDSPWKQGLYTPGLHIPVLPVQAIYDRKVTHLVVFAWNFFAQVRERFRDTKIVLINPLEPLI